MYLLPVLSFRAVVSRSDKLESLAPNAKPVILKVNENSNTGPYSKTSETHSALETSEPYRSSEPTGPRFINRPNGRPLSAILEQHSLASLRSKCSSRVLGVVDAKLEIRDTRDKHPNLARQPWLSGRLRTALTGHIPLRSRSRSSSEETPQAGRLQRIDTPLQPLPLCERISEDCQVPADSTIFTTPPKKKPNVPSSDPLKTRPATPTSTKRAIRIARIKPRLPNNHPSPAQRALLSLSGHPVRGPIYYEPARYVRVPRRVQARLVSIKQAVPTKGATNPNSIVRTVDLISQFPSPPETKATSSNTTQRRVLDDTSVQPAALMASSTTQDVPPILAPSPRRASRPPVLDMPNNGIDAQQQEPIIPLPNHATSCITPTPKLELPRPNRPRPQTEDSQDSDRPSINPSGTFKENKYTQLCPHLLTRQLESQDWSFNPTIRVDSPQVQQYNQRPIQHDPLQTQSPSPTTDATGIT